MFLAKRIFLILCFLSVSAISWATTYYISSSGNDSIGDGSSLSPWATLSKAFASMSGGDTLIIKDGTYTGSNNQISNSKYPPLGSPGAWTIIKAEHDGEAVFDGEGTRPMFLHNDGASSIQSKYWQFEGIIWARAGGASYIPTVGLYYSRYVKFLRCGAYDAPNGNTVNFGIGRDTEYILLENCYAWGTGRYKFLTYYSRYNIFRQCVGRTDNVDTFSAQPVAGLAVYNSTSCVVQNCIILDADQADQWTYNGLYGTYYVVVNPVQSTNITFTRCIALNNRYGGIQADSGSQYITWDNCVIWKCNKISGEYPSYLRSNYPTVNNCTIGDGTVASGSCHIRGDSGKSSVIKNSIIYSMVNGYATRDIMTKNYNCYFANTDDDYNNNLGANSVTTINPLNNSLKYLTRIENGSDLSSRGEGGGNIGANCLTMIGRQGTLWGETGYNEEQDVSMWPFPYEDLIRSKMKAYYDSASGISGNRGFCADGMTLTKYIWEYLGNPAPAEFTSWLNAPSGLSVVSASSSTISLTWTDKSSSETGYNLERKIGQSGSYVVIALPKANEVSYTDIGLIKGTTYYYRIRAYNSTTYSSYSNEVAAVTVDSGASSAARTRMDVIIVGSSEGKGIVNPNKGDTASINFQGEKQGDYECRIFMPTGEQVWQDIRRDVTSGTFQWIPKDMAPGTYIVSVVGPGTKIRKKIVIVR